LPAALPSSSCRY